MQELTMDLNFSKKCSSIFPAQMVEHNGFYRTGTGKEQQFVRLERIQFVGACNPPTDPGRKPLSHRQEGAGKLAFRLF